MGMMMGEGKRELAATTIVVWCGLGSGDAREVYEEYRASIKGVQFLTAKNVLRNNKGIPTHWVSLLFAVEIDPSSVAIGEPEKMDAIGWFREEQFPLAEDLHSSFLTDYAVVKKALTKIK